MIRRHFLNLMTLTGAGGVAALCTKGFAEKQFITYTVRGFTCVTCATGLETLLQREEGILSVEASYPTGLVTVVFDAKSSSPADIMKVIESMGFKARVHPATSEAIHRDTMFAER